MQLTFDDLVDGMEFTAYLDGTKCTGRVAVYDGYVFLCQNEMDGMACEYERRLGYEYSWVIKEPYNDFNLEQSFKENCVKEFRLINNRKERIEKFFCGDL